MDGSNSPLNTAAEQRRIALSSYYAVGSFSVRPLLDRPNRAITICLHFFLLGFRLGYTVQPIPRLRPYQDP